MSNALFRLRVLTRHIQPAAVQCRAGSISRTLSLVPTTTNAAAVRSLSTKAGSGKKISDYSRFISPLSMKRQPSAIRSLMALVGQPGMISLGGGLPNPAMFPFESLSFTLKPSGQKLELTAKEMADGLQYSATPGLPALIDWLRQLQYRTHRPPYTSGVNAPDWGVTVTVGSQDAICKSLDALITPGDTVLTDSPTYSGTLSYLKPMDCKLAGVETDADGIVPAALEKAILSANPKPKILYTIPTGCNPSGATYSEERRAAVYALACKHDLLILEDDPYYFLYFGDEPAPAKGQEAAYKRPVLNSLLSRDVEGRVLRFDSLSKVLSAGMRLGFATGPTPLIERINLHSQATNLHPSGVSQALALKLLSHWGVAGWDAHINQVSIFYARKRDSFIGYARKHLTGLAEWTTPTAGMFVWFRLLHGITDTQTLISKKALEKKVLLVPGQAFSPNNEPSSFVRASYSTASDSDMDIALSRLAEVIKEAKKA